MNSMMKFVLDSNSCMLVSDESAIVAVREFDKDLQFNLHLDMSIGSVLCNWNFNFRIFEEYRFPIGRTGHWLTVTFKHDRLSGFDWYETWLI